MKLSLIHFILLALLVTGCTYRRPLSEADFRKWVNGGEHLHVRNVTGTCEISVQYVPKEYLALNELNDNFSEADLAEKIKGHASSHMLAFCIIKHAGAGNILFPAYENDSTFTAQLNTWAHDIAYSVYLINGKDTLRCNCCKGCTKFSSPDCYAFGVLFPNSSAHPDVFENDLILVYNDILFNLGMQRFVLDKFELNNMPSLQM